jgi:hypothetical protein
MYANLYGNHKSGFTLEISNDIQTRVPLWTHYNVKGIKEARKIAETYKAKCWNF